VKRMEKKNLQKKNPRVLILVFIIRLDLYVADEKISNKFLIELIRFIKTLRVL
jgi:hypothetical protein